MVTNFFAHVREFNVKLHHTNTQDWCHEDICRMAVLKVHVQQFLDTFIFPDKPLPIPPETVSLINYSCGFLDRMPLDMEPHELYRAALQFGLLKQYVAETALIARSVGKPTHVPRDDCANECVDPPLNESESHDHVASDSLRGTEDKPDQSGSHFPFAQKSGYDIYDRLATVSLINYSCDFLDRMPLDVEPHELYRAALQFGLPKQ